MLNKLTAEKFEPLSKQMIDIVKAKVSTVEVMKGVINIIFDKALTEPGFSTMYAELCRVLEKSAPQFESTKEGKPQVKYNAFSLLNTMSLFQRLLIP